jgi:hypothetical protein
MVAAVALASAKDIGGFFIARKLEQGMQPQLVVIQLLMLFSLILLGQCLYWPVPFRLATPLQFLYLASMLTAMRCVKCAILHPDIAEATQHLCLTIQALPDFLATAILAVMPTDTRSTACYTRSSELLAFFWITLFGMVVPLYISYVTELSGKYAFLFNRLAEEQQEQLKRELFSVRAFLQQRLRLHVGAAVTAVMLCVAAAEGVLLVVPGPPACPAS